MSNLLLVAVTPDEESTLSAAVGPERCRVVPVTDLRNALDEDVDAVVVGSTAPSPLATVQWVHRAKPLCGVLLLTAPETDAELRRSAMYAPDMPASLTILESKDSEAGEQAAGVLEASTLRRVHQETLSAVSSRESVSTPHALAPASVGALLDNAPFGVLVGDVEGRLVTWNRWAGDLLELPNDAAGESIPALFPAPDYLDAAFALARAGRLDESAASSTLEGPGDTAVEVSTASTRLENGDDAVLVLILDVSARRQAERTRDRLAEHVGLLGRVSEALAGTLDAETALVRLADQMVPAFADWVSIQTYDERGQSRRVVVRHRDRALEHEAAEVREGLMSGLGETSPSRRVVLSGQPVLLQSVAPDELAEFVPDEKTRAVVDRMGVDSVLSVPLPGRDEVRGSMSLVRGAGSPAYTPQDLAVGVEVGRRAGVALDTLSLYARQRDLAAELQRSLLTEPPENERTEVVVRYVAAAEEAQVGGDWYDAFLQADGGTVLVIGDVMGHDTRAAAAMGQLRALLRGISFTTGTGPAEMLSRLDEAIEGLQVKTTATGLVVRVEPRAPEDTGPARLCWSNAGHPPPIVVPPVGGAVALENEEPDLLLGVLAHTERQETSAFLEPGGTLLLYTDGLIERRGESLDQGVATLTAAVDRLAGLPLPVMCDRLLAELLPDDNEDDVALVAVRLRTPGEVRGVPQ
ncbi:MAG TPA: SpoIIE family protein phosphatase [Nocardioidaceae bacterium]|nr:SpoIIE family protein phosphatase [Nocardioidaceae bacterium]